MKHRVWINTSAEDLECHSVPSARVRETYRGSWQMESWPRPPSWSFYNGERPNRSLWNWPLPILVITAKKKKNHHIPESMAESYAILKDMKNARMVVPIIPSFSSLAWPLQKLSGWCGWQWKCRFNQIVAQFAAALLDRLSLPERVNTASLCDTWPLPWQIWSLCPLQKGGSEAGHVYSGWPRCTFNMAPGIC